MEGMKNKARSGPDLNNSTGEPTLAPVDSALHPPYPPGYEHSQTNMMPAQFIPPARPVSPGVHLPDLPHPAHHGQQSGLRRLELTVSSFIYETVDSHGHRTVYSGPPVILNPSNQSYSH